MSKNINKNWEYTIKSQYEFIVKCLTNSIAYAEEKKAPLAQVLAANPNDAYFQREVEKFSDRADALADLKTVIGLALQNAYNINLGIAEPNASNAKSAESKKSADDDKAPWEA